MYHVTPKSNLVSIKKYGLIPKIGSRSRELGEPTKYVYLFPTYDDMDTALGSWLGDEFEDVDVAILPVKLTEKDVLKNDNLAEYERATNYAIKPELIDWDHVEYE